MTWPTVVLILGLVYAFVGLLVVAMFVSMGKQSKDAVVQALVQRMEKLG